MKTITFTLNGRERSFDIEPDETLIDLLRRSNLTGTKRGCDTGMCGSCAVIMDDRAVNACILFAFQADGRTIETIEGVGDFDSPHPLQTAMADTGAVQCGFCTPGIVMTANALLRQKPDAAEEDFNQHLDGNLCRCTGYVKIKEALLSCSARAADKGDA